MNWTTCCDSSQASRCARGAMRLAARQVLACLLWCVAILGIPATPAVALADNSVGDSDFFVQSGSGHVQGPFNLTYSVNNTLGATRFYNEGLTGTNAVMANIEAGYIWNAHETLTHVGIIGSNGAAGEFDRHATWVGMVMGGRPTDPANEYQRGMAPSAQLVSGAIATSWPSNATRYTGSFNFDPLSLSTYGPYRAAFISGVTGAGGTRTADVVNSSYVTSNDFSGLTATDQLTGTLDALMKENPRTLMTVAAGNTLPTGVGPNKVPGVASAFNAMTVAALAIDGGAFENPSYFSNGGPNDYYDSTTGFVSQARQVVDIAAPGESVAMAYYGGQTGGNGPGVSGPANGPAGGPEWYSRNVSGTSFSAPTVAGGAALLYDAAYARLASDADSRDSRVMKAVLMNSADKTVGWDNGQTAHPNGFGGVLTTQGLDNRVGTGRMNLSRAFDQFLSGTKDVAGTGHGVLGNVSPTGWDFGEVAEGTTNDYLINGLLTAGSAFTATLDWFRDRRTSGTTGFLEESYDNLDLELWSAASGAANQLIAESRSLYNNAEHFNFTIPTNGQYLLRVRWAGELYDNFSDANATLYGLAWTGTAVPEPTTIVLLALVMPALFYTRRRSLKHLAAGLARRDLLAQSQLRATK